MEYTIGKDNSTSKTLYIIGNGFDLAHKIKSSYSDFWKQYIGSFEEFLPGCGCYWNDLEEALGRINESSVLKVCMEDRDFDTDHSLSSAAIIEDLPEYEFKPVVEKFPHEFAEWVRKIDVYEKYGIDSEEDELPYRLDKNGLFLSFNYTETLEEIYKIPGEQICHIHGFRENPSEKLIIGHNNIRIPSRTDDKKNEDPTYIYYAKKSIIEITNTLKKEHDVHIRRHSNFFSKLKNVEKIIVYGHSMGEIDFPYFEHIMGIVGSKVPWDIYDYQGNNGLNINDFIRECKPKNVNRIIV